MLSAGPLGSKKVSRVRSRKACCSPYYAAQMCANRRSLSIPSLRSWIVWLCALPLSAGTQAQGPKAVPAGTEHLVWSDEFSAGQAEPDPANWNYETGGGGWGNEELEVYCSPRTTDPPCDPAAQPNSFIGADGVLHIVARRSTAGQWTSARLVSQGLQSFQYGRIEARIKIPRGQGVWPAFWMLGEDIKSHPWPACGEIDIMENIGKEPGTVHGTLHAPGYAGLGLGKPVSLSAGQAFADDFHNYGVVWSPGQVAFYVDDPGKPYARFTPKDMPKDGQWPFDQGRFFLLLNLAIGGKWPGPPDPTTAAPAEMLVKYVRVYQNGADLASGEHTRPR